MLHVFLSAAYLVSLAVTVLILYVMNLPVSNAVQGAYVVAAVMTGLILGGGAIVFSEMTEGLGCLLGGFCLSMWLLVLKPGGLLTTASGKSILIAVFTIASFATSFSRYTRPYGLMIFISLGGATAVVIGIDCFSRAGLKEFWAYIWNLNGNLFPVGATTYPLTRGIKVEIAAIVVIFLVGIISQVKLWKVIQQRRAERAAERLEDERTIQQEEENVGRRIENLNAEDRHHWEAVYGDKDQVNKSSNTSQRDSGVGDMDSQKKGPMSVVTSIRRSGEDDIEMSEMVSPTSPTGAGIVMASKGQDKAVTVRVARDQEPEPELNEDGKPVERALNRTSHASARSSLQLNHEEEKVWVMGADGEARLDRRPSQRRSLKRISNPPVSTRASAAPEVVPLPFKVPEGEIEDDRSSVATFADDEQPGERRNSKRLSGGSAILRRLSKISQRNSSRLSNRISIGEEPSTEDLIVPREVDHQSDRASSVAATMDGLSDDDEIRSIRSSIYQAPDTTVSRTPALDNTAASSGLSQAQKPVLDSENVDESLKELPAAGSKELGEKEDNIGHEDRSETTITPKSLTSSTDPKPDAKPSFTDETPEESEAVKSKAAPSVVSTTKSRAASITKENLPPLLSKVVMSYRTNEWAKHLSNADAPEVESPKVEEFPLEEQSGEKPAPVKVEDLQQTPENALPPPVPSVSKSPTPNAPALTRSSSAQSKNQASPYQSRPESANGLPGQDSSVQRSLSQQSLSHPSSQSNLNRLRTSSNPAVPRAIVESPSEFVPTNFPFTKQNAPFGSTNTLIGKRDSMVRKKSSYIIPNQLPSTPENPVPQYGSLPQSRAGSDAGSLYNYQNNTSMPNFPADDDNMSLSARRNLIRQTSLQQIATPVPPLPQMSAPFDSHQPRRQSSAPSPMAREQQLASWRASVQQDLQNAAVPKMSVERQRSALWQERQAEEQKRAIDARRRGERDNAFDERMRRGDMLEAHREALRKLQATANRNA